MAHFNFVIPSKLQELLTDNGDYFVSKIIGPKELLAKLKEASQSQRDEGPEFILDNFDVYYSVLHLHTQPETKLPMNVLFQAYQELHKAAGALNKSLRFILQDKSGINDELKQKYQIVMKMLIYIYINTVLSIEEQNLVSSKNQALLKGRKKPIKNDFVFNLNKTEIVLTLNNILQSDIAIFWDPPVVEESFINMVAEICYKFLENPLIKGEKEVKEEVFNLIGTLIKTYNHSTTFSIRMAQKLKDEEHLVQCLSDGVKQLINMYNCKGLIHALVREVTEWQTDEKFQDSQGSKHCAQFLTAMAVAVPDLMLPEVLYLNKYLGHESGTLRNSVLNVITEVILHVLSKHSANNEETEYREEFMSILLEHIRDNSANVRSKVMQHWARLQEENAIPRSLTNEVLRNIIEYHLHDRAALVRKSAINCVTTFLSHNTYSATLSLAKLKADLKANQSLLDSLQPQIGQAKLVRSEEMEAEWTKLVPNLQKALLEELQKKDDKENEEPQKRLTKTEATDIIRMYLNAGKYREAFIVWKTSTQEFEEIEENAEQENIMEEFLSHLKAIYMEQLNIPDAIRNAQGDIMVTEEDFRKFEALREKVEYLKDAVTFIELIDTAIPLIIELLDTTCISDMQGAVAFFISAYQFDIDNSHIGITAMLQMMQRNEQERKDVITEAFKSIYLKTETSNMQQHCVTIVKRLILLVKSVPSKNLEDLEMIISGWVDKGVLDNNVIDMLWQYFVKKVPVSDDDAHASVELLRMAALSRKTIITRNIKLVSSIGFGDMGQKNLAFLGSVCNFLALAGRDRIDITSKEPPFKIGPEDEIFKDLFGILLAKFSTPAEFYHPALAGAIEFVYKVCGKPDELCEQFIIEVIERFASNPFQEVDLFIYIRLCELMGLIAIKHLDYLDETVYRELKRRQHCRNTKDKSKVEKKNRKGGKRKSNNTTHGEVSTLADPAVDESNLEGAQAEDEDAEFILHVLERNTVMGSGLLAHLAPIIINVCEKPDEYNDVYLQGAAVTALIRYMLVSSEFCMKHIQLLFTILQKSKYLPSKLLILQHLSDLFMRFPNVIEPWTSRIYDKLKDQYDEIRKAAFRILSGLILRDVIRAHSHIHLMVNSFTDTDKELHGMCRTFFTTLSKKENNLYNVLPDIFSHLMDSEEITDEQSKDIMKFLFELMDKTKHMENLVDRFCSKFECTEDIKQQRNIAYCLSLIAYNQKALKKLQENFSMYKHLVHDPEIYACFKTIIQGCSKKQVGKVDLKPIIDEIEKNISSVFEINEEAGPSAVTKSDQKANRSQRTARKEKTKKKRQRQISDSE